MKKSNAPLLDANGKKYIQQVIGKFLYLGQAVNHTLLATLSALGSQQSKLKTETMRKTKQFLNYVASQKVAILTYSAGDMVLVAQCGASYLNKTKAQSRAGRHIFLSKNVACPPNKGKILTVAQIIKNVMSLAAEAELGALFIVAYKCVYI